MKQPSRPPDEDGISPIPADLSARRGDFDRPRPRGRAGRIFNLKLCDADAHGHAKETPPIQTPSPLLLRDKARQCLDIADGVSDGQIVAVLRKVSGWFEAQADAAAPAPPAPVQAALPDAKPRAAVRKAVSIRATLRRQGESKFSANVADLSESGFRVESHYAIPMGAQVWLTLPGLAAVPAIVAWSSGHSLGCRFESPLHPAVLDRVIAASGG